MEKTGKVTSILLGVLMAISVGLFIYMIGSIDDELNPGPKAVQIITLNINWAIVLFVISTIIVLGFAIVQIFSAKGQLLTALGVLGAFAIVFLVSYFSASSEIPNFIGADKFVADGTLTETVSHWVGTGLYVTYILFAGAFLSIIGFGAVGIFKRS